MTSTTTRVRIGGGPSGRLAARALRRHGVETLTDDTALRASSGRS
ncbi:hypothetical protein [Nocardia nova]|nr:hypothetical protein [Nocardia nova]